jgi:hypothetical protein
LDTCRAIQVRGIHELPLPELRVDRSIAVQTRSTGAKRRLRQRTNTNRLTYTKPNQPDLNQSVQNYDENDLWIDYDYF